MAACLGQGRREGTSSRRRLINANDDVPDGVRRFTTDHHHGADGMRGNLRAGRAEQEPGEAPQSPGSDDDQAGSTRRHKAPGLGHRSSSPKRDHGDQQGQEDGTRDHLAAFAATQVDDDGKDHGHAQANGRC